MSSLSWRQMARMGVLVLLVTIVTTAYGQPSQLGDLNCDGVVNQNDTEPFLLAVNDPTGYAAQYPDCDINNADINGDAAVNSLDIPPFFGLLRGPLTAPVVPAAGLACMMLLMLLVGLTGLKKGNRGNPVHAAPQSSTGVLGRAL
jgi:hypothetical protein